MVISLYIINLLVFVMEMQRFYHSLNVIEIWFKNLTTKFVILFGTQNFISVSNGGFNLALAGWWYSHSVKFPDCSYGSKLLMHRVGGIKSVCMKYINAWAVTRRKFCLAVYLDDIFYVVQTLHVNIDWYSISVRTSDLKAVFLWWPITEEGW